MSEYINNVSQRKEKLKAVLQRLHDGQSIEAVKDEFGDLARQASSEEIAEAEQLLMDEGVPVEEIQRLCDLHVAVFRETLDQQTIPESIPGHPVHTFRQENEVLERYLEAMGSTLEKYLSQEGGPSLQTLQYQMAGLLEFDRHYRRKENLLFPFLEQVGIQGPSKVMWGIHNEIRTMWKGFAGLLDDPNPDMDSLSGRFAVLQQAMRDMVYKEENILFPTALQKLTEEVWRDIRSQEPETGYFLVTPGSGWLSGSPQTPVSDKSSPTGSPPEAVQALPERSDRDLLSLHTGALTVDQIDRIFRHLPVDITFVDENDTVRYFSQTRERIFERTEAIIGRKVQNCHPPQSVGRVQRILDDFRAGRRESAEFWIQLQGKFIHIRYFAVHDEQGTYCGTIETTQDLTAIRGLQGERRLLDD